MGGQLDKTAILDNPITSTPPTTSTEARMWHMRWFFAIVLALWILVDMIITVLVFCITKSPLSFSLCSTIGPPIYFIYGFAKYLLPMDERDFQLAAMKIQHTAQQKGASLNLPTTKK